MTLQTPYNLKAPASTPMTGVELTAIFLMQEGYPAGAPAGYSDGMWIRAQSADLSGMTSNGIAPDDGQYANDPRRAQAQPLPVPAGQPASFVPT
eukprot:664840-Pyramimonas_sp.AAC.1